MAVNTQLQVRRGTASQWTSANPTLAAGEFGFETDTGKFKIGTGSAAWASLSYASSNNQFDTSIVFEGATSNDFETTLLVTDPTADRTITLPDASGTVALTGTNVSFNNITATGDLSVTGDLTVSGTTTSINTTTLEIEDKNVLLAKVGPLTISASGTIASFTGDGVDPYSITIIGLSSTTGVVAGMNVTATAGTGGFGTSPNSITVESVSSGTSIVVTQTGGTSPTVGTITNIIVSGSDVTANGAGLTIQGTTNKTFNWVDSTDAFTSSEHIALANGKSFYGNLVGNVTGTATADASALTGTTLNSPVITSSLTTVGTITTGTWSANTIALNKGGTGATTQSGAANAVLPSQTSNANKILKTDGTNVSWTDAPSVASLTTSADLTVGDQAFIGTGATTFSTTTGALTNPAMVVRFDSGTLDNSYAQVAFQNDDRTSSTDFIAYSNNGIDQSGWIDIGITGEGFNQETYGITGPNDGYVFMQAPKVFTETVTNKQLTDNVATLTIGANDFRVGMPVTVTGVDATFNGTYTITARTSTTFSYAKTASNVESTAASGTAIAGVTGAGNLVLATGGNGTENKIVFAAGGLQSSNEQMSITPDVNVHIEIPTPSTSATTGALTVVGGVGISGDMNVQGNVAIQGTITFGGDGTTVSASNLAITDPMVFVGTNNQSDTVDLALIGEYASAVSTITRTVSNKALTSNIATLTTSANHTYLAGDVVVVSGVDATFNGTYNILNVPTNTTFTYAKTNANVTSAVATGSAAVSARRKFAGVARDASDGVIKVFKDATTKPISTINFSEAGLTYADMQVSGLTASSLTVGNVSNTEIGYLDGVTSSIQTQLNAKANIASPTFTGTPLSTTAAVDTNTTQVATTAYVIGQGYLKSSTASSTYAPLIQTTATPTFTSNNYTLVSGDKDKILLASNSATAGTVTVPAGVFATGSVITIVQTGTGQLTLTASGTTINSNGSKLKLNGQYASCQLICTASNTFLAIGNLAT